MKFPLLFTLLISIFTLPLSAAESHLLSDKKAETVWVASGSRMESVEIEGKPGIRWHLEAGQQASLSLIKEHPLFARLRYFDRIEFRFRIASGLVDFVDFQAQGHVSGSRQFKIHQWQAAIFTTPLETWHTRQLDFERPNWFPWDDPDGNAPHFRFNALAISDGTVIEMTDLRLVSNPLVIKPFFEYPITWPQRLDEADGSVAYRIEIPVLNTSGRPSTLQGKIVSEHPHFQVSLDPMTSEVANGKTATFTVTARLPKKEIDATPLLYSEAIRVAFSHTDSPEVVSTFELPVTRPLPSDYKRQTILSANDIAFVRKALEKGDDQVRKQLGIDRLLADADEFLAIRLAAAPRGHLGGRLNYWPVVPDTKERYLPGAFMPEIVNPVTGERETGTPTANRFWKEYLGQMGRITESLGYAYLFTGDEKYAAKAVELLEIWARDYDQLPWFQQWEPLWSNGPAILASSRIAPNSSYGSNWIMRYTMRMLNMISESPSFTPEARERVYRQFAQPYATEIAKFPGGISNMTDISNHNLLLMGLTFNDSNLVRWALLSDPGLLRRLADIDDDGFTSEGRPLNYHVAAMQEYLPSLAYLRHSGLKLDAPTERLLSAVRMPFQRATLWRVVPNAGDCGRGMLIGPSVLADDLIALYPDDEWLLDAGRGTTMVSKIRRLAIGRPVEKDAYLRLLETGPRLYRHAGLAILRTGDTPETQIMATLDFGRSSMHAHRDRNQITLAAFGKTFTHGPGTTYNAGRGGIVLTEDPELASFCGSHSIGQNVILVDARSQQTAIGELLASKTEGDEQFATARVPAIAPGVDHQRTLILRNGVVIILDELISKDEHTYDFAYHNFGKLTPGPGWQASPRAQPLATTANYANIRQLETLRGNGPLHLLWDLTDQHPPKAQLPGTPAHLALWQLPHPDGEVVTGITGMNNPNTTRVPDQAPSLFHRVKGSGVRFVTVLEPYKEKASITGIEGDDRQLTLHRNGKREIIRYSDYTRKH